MQGLDLARMSGEKKQGCGSNRKRRERPEASYVSFFIYRTCSGFLYGWTVLFLRMKKFRESQESKQKRIEAIKLSYRNNPDIRVRISKANKISLNRPEVKEKFMGDKNPAKRPEVKAKISLAIAGSKHLEKQNEEQRQFMLNGHAVYMNSFVKNPSWPQVKTYSNVKVLYEDAVLNYSLKLSNKKWCCLDIGIPSLKIDIEYDGSRWHKGREEFDKKRDEDVKKLGWKVLRYRDYTPSVEQLREDINTVLLNGN